MKKISAKALDSSNKIIESKRLSSENSKASKKIENNKIETKIKSKLAENVNEKKEIGS